MTNILDNELVKNRSWVKNCSKCHQIIGKNHLCPEPKNLLDRLLDKSTKHENGCLIWNSYVPADGYPRIHFPPFKRPIKASRAVWMYFYGDIPKGHYICHKCDNPKCWWIDHLWLGTPKDNVQDAIRKGRFHGYSSKRIG